ncbi:acyl-CoA dehydrogenase family protein [Streptomyces sp. NBC_01718]|uniref:acyl-CoA dehydrogenase family protein n=1 Tax=Streptomyces sp. NBC_01718 TaxID=2975919 RepID=UPI00352DD161
MIVGTVQEFADKQVKPVSRNWITPTPTRALIEQMKEMGIFGLAVPEEFGGTPVSTPCYVLIAEELARGWMSLTGAMGRHTVVTKLLRIYGTEEQNQRYLPRMATGEVRATMALTEPGGGSDLQAMRTIARRDGEAYVVNGSRAGRGWRAARARRRTARCRQK